MRLATAIVVVLMTILLVLLLATVIAAVQALPGAAAFFATIVLALVALSFVLAGIQLLVECLLGRIPVSSASSLARSAWQVWRALAERAALHQTRILLGIIYLFVCGPTWLALRLTGKRLLPQRPRTARTYWMRREEPSSRSFRRQF